MLSSRLYENVKKIHRPNTTMMIAAMKGVTAPLIAILARKSAELPIRRIHQSAIRLNP